MYNLLKDVPTIVDLSDAPKYTIKAVSAQTGIRAVTLRAWERRYRVLKPRRSAGNYRLYSERDVALLRWLKSRVAGGIAVSSAAAELDERLRAGRWPEVLAPPGRNPAAAPPAAAPPPLFARRLYQALIAHDEAGAAQILDEANALFDFDQVCLHILSPCLVEIGEAWLRGDIRISTEHFASTYLRGRLLAVLQTYPLPRGSAQVIVACVAGERHDIGGLMVSLFLRRAGYPVEFLGADVPSADLLDYVRDVRPALVCLSAGSNEAARELARVSAGLARLRPRPKLGFGGRVFNLRPDLCRAVPGVFLGETAAAAVAKVQALLPPVG